MDDGDVDGDDMIMMLLLLICCSVDEGNDLTLDTDFRVKILPDGTVTWGPGFRWRTACAVDLTYFPFDHQVFRLCVTPDNNNNQTPG